MMPEEVMELVKQGEALGCKEALFTLGDKPELRYSAARKELASLGHKTTLSYLNEIAKIIVSETQLLPHINGVRRCDSIHFCQFFIVPAKPPGDGKQRIATAYLIGGWSGAHTTGTDWLCR